MSWIPGQTLTIPFIVSDATGAAINVDEGTSATAKLLYNGAFDNTVEVVVTPIELGVYTASCVLPTTYQEGDSIAIIAYATVDSVNTKWNAWDGAVESSPLTAAAIWNYLATACTTIGSIGYQFRRLYAALHGNYTASYPSATSISTTFLDTDNATVIATVQTNLDSSGRPIARQVS